MYLPYHSRGFQIICIFLISVYFCVHLANSLPLASYEYEWIVMTQTSEFNLTPILVELMSAIMETYQKY